jgi:hypothetical protein
MAATAGSFVSAYGEDLMTADTRRAEGRFGTVRF